MPNSNRQVKLLIISSIWWASSAKIASAFLRNSCIVEAVCPPDHPFYKMRGFKKIYSYKRWKSLRSLCRAIKQSNPHLLIPCDDGVVWQLHAIHKNNPEFRSLIERSLGSSAFYGMLSERARTMEVAEELGIRIPKTRRITNLDNLESFFTKSDSSWVLKRDGTHAGKGVRIVHSAQETKDAITQMRRPSFLNALGRSIVIHDAVAIWSRRNVDGSALSLQQFIEGRPANLLMVCHQGAILGMVSVEVLLTEGKTGAALAARLIDNDEMKATAQRIAEHLKLSGFHGLDFILEKATEDAYFIELNPRCTQLGHLPVLAEGDLASIYALAYEACTSQVPQTCITNRVFAFFPQAILLDSSSRWLKDAYIDVPWSQPKLVAELMRCDWRDRSLTAQIINAFAPQERIVVDCGVPFEEPTKTMQTTAAYINHPLLSSECNGQTKAIGVANQ